VTADEPNVIEMPGSSEAKLERFAKKLDALDSHLRMSSTQRTSVLQGHLDAARDALGQLRAVHESRSALPSAIARELREASAALESQLKASADAAMRNPEQRRARIGDAGAALEGALAEGVARESTHGDAAYRHAMARYRRAMDDVDTALEIADACRRLLAPYRGRERSDRRRALRSDIAALQGQLETPRRRLAEHRRRTAVDRRRVEQALGRDLEAIAAALERWLP